MPKIVTVSEHINSKLRFGSGVNTVSGVLHAPENLNTEASGSVPFAFRLRLVTIVCRPTAAYPTLNAIIERTLRGSGVTLPTSDGVDGEIRVTVNNIADLGGAAARGFETGLTFGAVGSTVVDTYEMSASLNARGRTASRSGVSHSMYTAIGNTSLPPNVEVTTVDLAFQKVVESMLLRVLQEMQQHGDLPGSVRISYR